MRQALCVASECAPLVKTGGLADVVGALPGALAPVGWALRTLLPGYPAVMAAASAAAEVWRDDALFGGPARLLFGTVAGLELYILDAPHLYDRPGSIYLDSRGQDWQDNPERFAALCWVGAYIAAQGVDGWTPEVVHMHDWQAGFVPAYLDVMGAHVPSVITIHNVAFHGYAPANRLVPLRLPWHRFNSDGFEFYGNINALKAGITGAQQISTVSPTYAQELLTPEFGMGLDGVLRARQASLCGILNGIDEGVWSPATDAAITPYKAAAGKAANKAALQAEFGIEAGDGPLAIVVSRLSEQKGLDLLLAALPDFVAAGGSVALLGSGDKGLENAWLQASERFAAVGVRIGYDETLAHRMFAGGDAVLVPSRFEPCGLTQLYGLRYGTLPVVAMTGGLADTVINANDAAIKAKVATGIQFHPTTADALGHALGHLCALYADTAMWKAMQRNAMKHPVDWSASAPQYAALYERALAD